VFKVSIIRSKISASVLGIISVFLLQALAPGFSQVFPGFAATGWLPTIRLPKSLASHSTVIYSNRIYVIGGRDASENPINTVFYSVIGSSEGISNWEGATSLPTNLFAHTAVVSGERVYVTGGWNGADTSKLTYYALFDSNGLGNWDRASARLPIGLDLHSAVEYDGRIYVMGGWDGYQIVKTVYFASIEADGDIINWHSTTDLPQPIYRHSSVVYDRRIYVIGGRTIDKEPLGTVYMGTLTDSGVGTWIPTTPLPQKLYYQSAFVSNGKIYVMGGYDGSSATDKVYSTTIKADGSLEPWVEAESLRLPKKLSRHTASPAENGSVYLVGGEYNDLYINEVYFIPPLSLIKSNDPPGPVHEGDVITYTISYTNTGLIPQTNVVITDRIPSNTDWVHGSISPDYGVEQHGIISWTVGSLAVGETGTVSFQVRIPLLRHLEAESASPLCTPEPTPPPPARVLPAAISCDTTRFWAHGVTRQPSVSPPYTIEVQIPPNTSPSKMWLLMKGTDNTAPRVDSQPAQPLRIISDGFGASLWTSAITPTTVGDSQMVTVTTWNPPELNAIFLFDEDDPPFDERDLRVFAEAPTTFTYTLEIPSVKASTMDVLLPFMDITYWTDSSPPEFDGRMITVTVELEGEPTQTILANEPNMGNGLLMTQFPINLRSFTDTITKTRVLTITVDTEDDAVYTLGPRVCRPVYVENTAWLCSKEAGCISATTRNIPEDFAPLSIYLPIILKSSP
jgi:uncharacterized repeat protein (TIGR01451 family)